MASKAAWRIVPANTPAIIRRCSKCNRKIEYYCSEKFRVNANQARVDIWLIYKCTKCDSTWKLTIDKGIKPRDIPAELFERFINNDRHLAWKYAFDRRFLKENACVVDYVSVEYSVEGAAAEVVQALKHAVISGAYACDASKNTLHVRLVSPYIFELKLSAMLAKVLCVSVGQVRKLVDSGVISAGPEIDIIKHRIKSDLDVFINRERVL